MKSFVAKLKCRKGQGTVEYALITIAVVAIIGLLLITNSGASNPLSTAISTAFNAVSTQVTAALPK